MPRSNCAQQAPSLSAIAAFEALSPQTIERIEKHCAWRKCEPGAPIVNHLDQSSNVYFVVSGEVRVRLYSLNGRSIGFCDLKRGDMFGEVAAIDAAPRSASVEARTNCLVASITAEAFLEVVRSEHVVTLALLRHLAAKIRELTKRVYEFSALPVRNKIQSELLRLASLAPREGRIANISGAPTHLEIASRTSTHREAVSRELSRLSRLGLLERRGRGLLVKDVDRLAAMVHDATGE